MSDDDKKTLPEIIEEEADLEESLSEDLIAADRSIQFEMLAIENAKIRKENLILGDKINKLQK